MAEIKIEYGDRVRRKNHASGKEPAYRFEGVVCGSYFNPKTLENGSVVSLDHDPGCIQIFPNYMLERSLPSPPEQEN